MARQSKYEASKVNVQATASVTASFLSGAMVSLSAMVVPVLLDTNTESGHLVRQWARLYHYGHIYMPAICIAATGLFGYASQRKGASNSKQWSIYLAAGAVTISMVPFTWLMMAPTNNALFELDALSELTATSNPAVDLSTVRHLIAKWAWLHLARSAFPLVGAIVGLAGVLQDLGR